MEKIQSKYETIFVVSPELGDEGSKAVVEKFTTLISENATIDEVNDWGKRRLAYPINDLTEGYYTLVKFTSGHEFPRELDRIFNITDGILRSIIIKEGE